MEERVDDVLADRAPDDAQATVPMESVVVDPVFVITQTFPARPSSIPDIRDFVLRYLADAPLTPEGSQQIHHAVLAALLEAASPDGGQIQVCFRIFPDGVDDDRLVRHRRLSTVGHPVHPGVTNALLQGSLPRRRQFVRL